MNRRTQRKDMRKRKEKGEEAKSGRKRWRERTNACVRKRTKKKRKI